MIAAIIKSGIDAMDVNFFDWGSDLAGYGAITNTVTTRKNIALKEDVSTSESGLKQLTNHTEEAFASKILDGYSFATSTMVVMQTLESTSKSTVKVSLEYVRTL